MSLVGSITALVDIKQSGVGDLATPKNDVFKRVAIALASGGGLNQADQIWSDQRTLTTGANEDLDLSGALTDAFGNSITLTKLKAVLIFSAIANTTELTLSRPASNGVLLFTAAGDAIKIRPGGVFLWVGPDASGIAVTAGTGDLLNMANAAGASATYDIVVIGVD